MKVAVTSQDPDLNSAVDPHFGRAKFFIVVDTETGEFSAHDNAQNLNAVQGAGIQAGRLPREEQQCQKNAPEARDRRGG